MSEPMDPDQAQAKLDQLGEDIEATKRKVAEDLSRPSEQVAFSDGGSTAGSTDGDAEVEEPTGGP